jgi:hypothetical protein
MTVTPIAVVPQREEPSSTHGSSAKPMQTPAVPVPPDKEKSDD